MQKGRSRVTAKQAKEAPEQASRKSTSSRHPPLRAAKAKASTETKRQRQPRLELPHATQRPEKKRRADGYQRFAARQDKWRVANGGSASSQIDTSPQKIIEKKNEKK
jgi:hypothetical protein